MPPVAPVTSLQDETRIRDAERDIGQLKLDVSENQLKLSFLAQQVGEGYSRLSNEIKDALAPLAKEVAQHSAAIAEILPFVAQVKADRDKRAGRRDAWRKAGVAILVAGGGVALKELVVLLFHALS